MANGSERGQRAFCGVVVTAQTVALVVAVVAVAALIGLAILNWLEQLA